MTESTVTAREFFEKARGGQLTAIRCGSCGELSMPPRELCPSCYAHSWQSVALAGDGTIASFTSCGRPAAADGTRTTAASAAPTRIFFTEAP